MMGRQRHRRGFLVYGAACLLVLAAFGLVTDVLVDARVESEEALLQARRRGKERVALWRMDFAIAPLLAYETGRAIAIDGGFGVVEPEPGAFVLARFRQTGAEREVEGSPETATVARLERIDLGEAPRELVPESAGAAVYPAAIADMNGANVPPGLNNVSNDLLSRQLGQQRSNVLNPLNFQNSQLPMPVATMTPLSPLWIEPEVGEAELVLLRPAARGVQGVLLDREALQDWLLGEIVDLLPEARLEPRLDVLTESSDAALAGLPLRLVGGPPPHPARLDGSFRTLLGIAWLGVIGALVATGFVLRAVTGLSERRARFASTVTHELRTPLTTFRMYAQMLARDMVPDEQRRRDYLETLDQESERLARVVESVLLYSRLEEGSGESRREAVALEDLADRLLVPLGRIAQEAGMELDLEFEGAGELRLDPQCLEQILVNLVDNAAKYGRGEPDRVEVMLERRADEFLATVTDHGSGLDEREAKRLFEPFRRGRDHDGGLPGIGLGLALARGLARAEGGDLQHQKTDRSGATFRLRLPLS